MRSLFMTAALGSTLLSGAAAFAQAEGYFNVSYNQLGITLTQIGGYGELIVEPQGFADMSYGRCQVNFTRDDAGDPKDYTPVVQSSSASCPSAMTFTVAEGEGGMYKITFTEGGALKGETFDLYPVLIPMNDRLKVTAPQGFDILGATIGQTRTEIEALLTEKGFTKIEPYSATISYQGGYTKAKELWGKGEDHINADRPADQIAVSYTALIEGEESEEKVELLARDWRIPPADNLSLANLKKSLADKHGQPQTSFEARVYDRTGTFLPKEFSLACDPAIHVQEVSSEFSLIGSSESMSLSAACGAKIDIMVLEDYQAPGRASHLKVSLQKGDVAYESFWNTWSRQEALALKERYDLQAGMTGAAPEL